MAPRSIRIKRAYEPATADDGFRVLVDRLWPRGIRKDALPHDAWLKDIAPSPALRKWFGHKADHWERFEREYRKELQDPDQQKRMLDLLASAGTRPITLVYGAKDEGHNHARVLAEELMRLY